MKNSFTRVFFRGLITLLPIAITVYIFVTAVQILEGMMAGLLRSVLPSYIPGLGLFVTLALIYGFGLLLNNIITNKVVSLLEKKITEVPFIKAIYAPLKDLMNLFAKKDGLETNRVVMVEIQPGGPYALGLVTREHFEDIEMKMPSEGLIAVYFPFSYGLGGYTFLIPRSRIQETDIPVEKAMSLAITGWVKAQK